MMPILVVMQSLLGAFAGAAMLLAGSSILVAIGVYSLVGTLSILALAGLWFVLSQSPERGSVGLTDALVPRQ
jgi:hypothetical protein